jgi:hypothetical protein
MSSSGLSRPSIWYKPLPPITPIAGGPSLMQANSRGWIANRKLGTFARTSGNQVVPLQNQTSEAKTRRRCPPGHWCLFSVISQSVSSSSSFSVGDEVRLPRWKRVERRKQSARDSPGPTTRKTAENEGRRRRGLGESTNSCSTGLQN